ncbi:Nitrate reductase [NADPH] [Psilocybe cubensis]|uniref:Nitrate reductase [NADPH] n=1 Tax=Psilocybe cubensis TaxID=181762 RepID=A0ACB8GTQ0_PSICU|nr:Nitrate reductase [NADPH] [Psilocybe cubensis]KAH9478951.1 Nitrate reductase [NADPH] [Psilocybe cubensis]
MIDDLRTNFRVVTMPITLVCAGNRRKEQNVVQQSLGFSWGAAGLSTALFTGVYLADVLRYVHPVRGAKHVIFEGVDDLPNGPYGTSQLLSWASDVRQGMMIAWAMNGLALEPDHGYPLRLVVPGQIGGRSVKWLSRIELSATESQHHLHFHDNKVLPMPLGPDQARKEKDWWYDSRYIIRDLNVNSAIARPNHDEVLDITVASHPTYTVKGYAYAGGGRRVTRVELSLDNGSSWELALIQYPEDAYRNVSFTADPIYGDFDMMDSDTCFCWCFWSFEVSVERFLTSDAMMVRAMDESLALQPRDMYWNATVAGAQPGGWIQRLKDAGLDPTKPDFSSPSNSSSSPDAVKINPPDQIRMTNPSTTRKISQSELESDEAKREAWFVVRGEVYIGSKFFKDHPGGAPSIELVAGEDATEDFMAIHSSDAQRQLADFHIGTMIETSLESGPSSMPSQNFYINENDDATKPFLQTKKWKSVKLVEIRPVSRNTKIFRFALRDENQELGLAFGQHLYVRLRRKVAKPPDGQEIFGEMVQRAYTPLFERNDRGYVDLLVKIYHPTPEFPEGGRITLGFNELTVGDSIELKGPIGNFIWKGRGRAFFNNEDIRIAEIGLVCAGSGVTPILQIMRAILNDPQRSKDDKNSLTKVWVLDVNRDFEDILCKKEIDRLVRENPGIAHVHYSLTGKEVPDGWEHSIGRITADMLVKHLPRPGQDKVVCLCGPHSMEQTVKEST